MITPTIEDMVSDLKAAGWQEIRLTVWRAPGGAYYRGPFGAWKVLQSEYTQRGCLPAAPPAINKRQPATAPLLDGPGVTDLSGDGALGDTPPTHEAQT